MNDKVVIIDQRPTTNDHRPDSCPQVSVHVLIYNGSWERVRATLNSVIMQKGIDFELIIVDDCSKVNLSDKIKDFLSRHNFTNYRLIVHEKNLGIVATCLEAAKESRAEYTRGLGQGDMFFDEYALKDSYDYMVKTGAEVMISKAVWYRAFTNPIEISAHRRLPQNVKAYDDPDELRESYLIHCDNVSGATVMYRCDIFFEYMTEAVSAGMKYLEDIMITCMVFDMRRIKFFDRNVIFYEFGAGISTTKGNNTPYRTNKMREAWFCDKIILDVILQKRCELHNNEFSKKFMPFISSKRNMDRDEKAKWKARQKLKARLGIAAIPLVWINNFLNWIKKKLTPKKEYIMTDVNVPTDFANLCINRE